MKNFILKSIFFLFIFNTGEQVFAQNFELNITNNNLTHNVQVRVYDAGNNLLADISVNASSTNLGTCYTGVPSYIHYIELTSSCSTPPFGGCLWSANINTTTNCTTCGVCTCWTTANPTFTSSYVSSAICSPLGYKLDITIS